MEAGGWNSKLKGPWVVSWMPQQVYWQRRVLWSYFSGMTGNIASSGWAEWVRKQGQELNWQEVTGRCGVRVFNLKQVIASHVTVM